MSKMGEEPTRRINENEDSEEIMQSKLQEALAAHNYEEVGNLGKKLASFKERMGQDEIDAHTENTGRDKIQEEASAEYEVIKAERKRSADELDAMRVADEKESAKKAHEIIDGIMGEGTEEKKEGKGAENMDGGKKEKGKADKAKDLIEAKSELISIRQNLDNLVKYGDSSPETTKKSITEAYARFYDLMIKDLPEVNGTDPLSSSINGLSECIEELKSAQKSKDCKKIAEKYKGSFDFAIKIFDVLDSTLWGKGSGTEKARAMEEAYGIFSVLETSTFQLSDGSSPDYVLTDLKNSIVKKYSDFLNVMGGGLGKMPLEVRSFINILETAKKPKEFVKIAKEYRWSVRTAGQILHKAASSMVSAGENYRTSLSRIEN